jgi:hypothetical protein
MNVTLKRKNYDDFTETFTKRIKVNNTTNKRKNDYDDFTCTQNKKRLKIDHYSIIEENILLIEYGMCSRKLLNECKDRYINYVKNKEMIEFLNLMECKKTLEDEMYLYKLVYKIEKSLLSFL